MSIEIHVLGSNVMHFMYYIVETQYKKNYIAYSLHCTIGTIVPVSVLNKKPTHSHD